MKKWAALTIVCLFLHVGYSDMELVPGDEPSNPSEDYNKKRFESAIHDYSEDIELEDTDRNRKSKPKTSKKDRIAPIEEDFNAMDSDDKVSDTSEDRDDTEPIGNYVSENLSPRLDEYNLPNCLLDSKIGMCINDPYYPKEQILKIVESTPNLELTSPNDVMHPIHIPIDYSANVKDDTLPRQCLERVQAVYPHVGKTMEYGYVYIVNVNRYQQPMVLRSCSAQDSKCNNIPGATKATCRQHYLNSKLKVIHPQRSEIADALVQIPSSCDCYMTREASPVVQKMGLFPGFSINRGSVSEAATQLWFFGALLIIMLQRD